MKRSVEILLTVAMVALLSYGVAASRPKERDEDDKPNFLGDAQRNGEQLIDQGRKIFRFDTFGDEAFWGDQLHLHQAINTLTPRQALALGLKVDADALPDSVIEAIKQGKVNLNDPSVTLALIKANAVLGVVGTFNDFGTLKSVGLTCAVCHSTVDDSIAPGIGRRIDGLANRDLNVGAIIAAAPELDPVVNLLKLANPAITSAAARQVLHSWGPGKFDAELFLDGKAFNPRQITNGVTTAENVPGATLIPNARGLVGHNLHTWTGGWGTITYWNAFVAVLELHGKGTFFDERFDDAAQFPIAAKAGLGHVLTGPDEDQVTSKLGPLQFYQLSLPSIRPRPNVDFDPSAAQRGDELFSGKANCNSCHHEPLWSEPGWNQHTAAEMKIDDFEAERAPGRAYQTVNLGGIFVREEGLFMKSQDKGRFYHDGRFKTLLDVVNSYDERFDLRLTQGEKLDLVEYLKSL